MYECVYGCMHVCTYACINPAGNAAIQLLKNNKACGIVNVINEFFKHCNDCLGTIVDFSKLF